MLEKVFGNELLHVKRFALNNIRYSPFVNSIFFILIRLIEKFNHAIEF